MKRLSFLATLLLAALIGVRAYACGCSPQMTYSNDAADRQQAIEEYRELGPQGLKMLLNHREALLKSGEEAKSPKMLLLNEAIDAVGGAKYCTTSRLYWHTDFAKAVKVASEENKPILSLRMLGNLTDDLSCANSRFFRTTLYANEEISNLLREKFVLHWQSVRPVPKITIDFGDGRKLERTITGNSAHYVMMRDGTVVDCLPGLYGPQAFLEKLDSILKITQAMPPEGEARRQYLVGFHQSEETKILAAWRADLEKIGVAVADANNELRVALEHRLAYGGQQRLAAAPAAEEAAFIARPKNDVERPAIRAIVGRAARLPSIEQATTEQVWEQLAKLHAEEARLDPASRNLIASHNPTAAVAVKLAITKRKVENPLVKMLRGLEEAIAIDTVRNEYELHRKLHRWFVDGTAPANVDELNERVYAELFLTPKSDPWLGLLPSDSYSALPNNGVVTK